MEQEPNGTDCDRLTSALSALRRMYTHLDAEAIDRFVHDHRLACGTCNPSPSCWHASELPVPREASWPMNF